MRVEYKNTFLDLFRYQISHQFRMPILQAVVLFFSGLFFFQAYPASTLGVAATEVAIFFVAIWLFQILFMLVLLLVTKRKTLITWHVITLTDEGLQEESAFSRTVAFWKGGIVKVRRRAGCIAIYVTPLSAHLVPVRAFPTAEDAERFHREVEARSRAA